MLVCLGHTWWLCIYVIILLLLLVFHAEQHHVYVLYDRTIYVASNMHCVELRFPSHHLQSRA